MFHRRAMLVAIWWRAMQACRFAAQTGGMAPADTGNCSPPDRGRRFETGVTYAVFRRARAPIVLFVL
jgi:hypothetical protein